MRESHSLVSARAIKPTLETVGHQFEAWRKRRRCRSRIPESLWQAAVGLCEEHSICEVSRVLQLNYSRLKDHVPKVTQGIGLAAGQHPELGFVRLDFGGSMAPSECLVEMEASNGAKMRMSFRGIRRDFDPVELSQVFWRQGR